MLKSLLFQVERKMFGVLICLLTVAALAASGYSHYRYRVKNNLIYQQRFGKGNAE
jgi:hypothetical protein